MLASTTNPKKVGKIDFDFAYFFGIFVPQTDHIYLEIFRKLLIRVCYNKNILVTSTMFNRLIYYRSSIINPRWDIDLNPASSKVEMLWMHPRKFFDRYRQRRPINTTANGGRRPAGEGRQPAAEAEVQCTIILAAPAGLRKGASRLSALAL